MVNGDIVAQGSQFSLRDLEVTTATVDLDEVLSARFAPSLRAQASKAKLYYRIHLDVRLTHDPFDAQASRSPTKDITFHCPEEEIALSPACW